MCDLVEITRGEIKIIFHLFPASLKRTYVLFIIFIIFHPKRYFVVGLKHM